MPSKAPQLADAYSPERLAGLRAASAAKKQATVDRLQSAINALLSTTPPRVISLANVAREGGPSWSTIKDNAKALELWERYKPQRPGKTKLRDPVLAYSRGELIAELRRERQRVAELTARMRMEEQAHVLTRARYENLLVAVLQRDDEIAQLQTKLAKYEQHLTNLRESLNQSEHN